MPMPTTSIMDGGVLPDDTVEVIIVDPHALVRAGLRHALGGDPTIRTATEATTAAETKREILRTRPDVALIGVQLPDADGIDLCAWLRSAHPEVTVILCSAEVTAGLLPRARLAGAAGLLTRSADLDRIRSAVTAAANGERHGSLWPDVSNSTPPPGSGLTDREGEVVALAAEGKTNAEIGAQLGIVEDTVKTHVQNAMRKLDASNRAHLVTVALRRNLLPETHPIGRGNPR